MANDEPSLFRREAIDAGNMRLGSAIKPVGVTGLTLTAFLLLILISAAIFLSAPHYTRKETVFGILEPSEGAARLVAPRPGVVASVRVHEGQSVKIGEPLFVINQDVVTDTGATLGNLLAAATDAQARALKEQIRAHKLSNNRQRIELIAKRQGLLDHRARLVNDLHLQSTRILLEEQSLESFKILNERQLVSDLQYRDRQESVIQARQNLSTIQKDADDTTSNLAQINAVIARLESDFSETKAQLDSALAQLQEREANNTVSKEIVLTAPKAGRVVAIQIKMGSSVVSSAALAIILPDGTSLHAELWAPSRAAGFVRADNRVKLMLDAFPYQKFGVVFGRVTEVASAPTPPTELPVPIETKESLYRIDVALERQAIDGYGKSWHFSPGMRLNADLILEKRTFLEWLLEPLYAALHRST